jgi:hypothetical protein
MERAGVVGREGNGYYIKDLPNLAQGMQHWVRVVLRAAKELTDNRQPQIPPVIPPPLPFG